jgi:hypothetical protein
MLIDYSRRKEREDTLAIRDSAVKFSGRRFGYHWISKVRMNFRVTMGDRETSDSHYFSARDIFAD